MTMTLMIGRCALAGACLLATGAMAGSASIARESSAASATVAATSVPATPKPPTRKDLTKVAPERIAVLDWTIAETMAAMGIFPAAIAEKNSYEVWSRSPAMPAATLDLGMRAQPNPDRMIRLAPDLILASQDYAFVKGMLERIGPTTLLDVYTPGQDIYQNLSELATRIGQITGYPDKAAKYIAQIDSNLDTLNRQLVQHRGQPVAVIQFIDARNVRVYGKPSIFSTALEKIGINNAWKAAVNQWGFQSADLTHLATLPQDTTIFIIEPYPADLPKKLQENVLWQALPAVRKNRIVLVKPTWTLGGLSTVLRFAHAVRDALLAQDSPAHAQAAFRFPEYNK
ncbi:MAG: iron-siderophore ABC transporter substrate-binding protein [Advenella sp.]|uniref:iron-siderophore ABC transporter substrate-binding protein n=1 Tax=Advenella sp. S44 TaxID=1982755 RepID=UPI0013747155|nr:iron-siderophore ABC transporter substrate-binding protein [Advenella sp. S44]